MSWVLVYLIALMYPLLIGFLLWKLRPWKLTLLAVVVALLPAAIFMWPYFKIKGEHEHLCALDGGLKVLRQPDRADSVRIYLSKYAYVERSEADRYIRSYAPKLKYLELHVDEEKAQGRSDKPLKAQELISGVYTYQINPEYENAPIHRRNESFQYMAVYVPDMPRLQGSAYEFREREEKILNGTRTVMELSRGGEVYVSSVYYRHVWPGIKYPDAVEDFRCPANRYGTPNVHPGDLINLMLN